MSYGNEEFLIILNDIRRGLTTKETAKKHYMSEKTIRKLLNANGYKYDKKQQLWYSTAQKRGIDIMNNCDIEAEIEELSKNRYYDRYVDPYPCEEEQKQETINIHKGIYEEIEELSEEYGCSYPEELIELVILRFLESTRKKDLTTIFRKKYFLEHGFNEREVSILMKYTDNDTIAGAESVFWEDWEDDTKSEAQELKEFYKRELQKNNIDLSDMDEKVYFNSWQDYSNEFEYLKEKYDEMTGNTYFKDLAEREEEEYWNEVEEDLNKIKQSGQPYDEDDLKLLDELKEYKKKKGDKCE